MTTPTKLISAAVFAVFAAGVPFGALAQDTSPQEQYKLDRAKCNSGNINQSKADCLYEARSVLRDRRQGVMEMQEVEPTVISANALSRCSAVPMDAKDSCERLVRGEGYREGSVAEGAVVMWLATADTPIVVGTAPQ